jgi:hypothetical protein
MGEFRSRWAAWNPGGLETDTWNSANEEASVSFVSSSLGHISEIFPSSEKDFEKRPNTALTKGDKSPVTGEIGAVRIRTKKFGAIWLALDQNTADELRAEEQQREHPRPVLMADDVAHLESKSEAAIRGALEVIRAFPGARILH